VAFLLTSASLAAAPDPPSADGRKASDQELAEAGLTQDVSQLDLEKLIEVGQSPVDVASARPVSLPRVPGAVTVYSSEAIRTLGASTLLELLRLTPGFDVTIDDLGRSRIAVRGVTSATQGGGSDLVLILLDGVSINEGVLGGAGVVNRDLPLAHTRQVEILRGPASALYGDAAVAAVINLVSDTTADFKGTEVEVGLGSWWTQAYTLRSGGFIGGLKISGYLRFAKTDGAQRLVPADAQTIADQQRAAEGLPPISLAPGKSTDGGHALDAAYSFNFREWTFSFRTTTERSEGFVGAGDSLGRQTDLNSTELLLNLGYVRTFSSLGTVRARVGFMQSEISDLLEVYPSGYQLEGDFGTIIFGVPGGNGGVFQQNSFNERRYDLRADLDRDLGTQHKLTVGVGLKQDSTFGLEANANLDLRTLTPIVPPDPNASLAPLEGAVTSHARTTTSLDAEDAWSPSKQLTVTGSLRFDYLSDVGGTLSPRLALVGSLPEGLAKHLPKAFADGFGYKLLYARGFRAPTFRELAFDLPGGSPNPDLRLVTANDVELALLWSRGRTRIEAHPFLTFVGDMVAPAGPVEVGTTFPYQNGSGLKTGGVEVVLSQGFGQSHAAFLNYTYEDASLRATGAPVPGIPSQLLNLGATFNFHDRWSVTPTLAVRSQRPRGVGDPRPPVDGYALFGVAGRARNVLRNVDLVLTVQNLFAKGYWDPAPANGVPGDYPRPGARVFVHASLRF
jgi:outer membrane receptor protein involved in Fe transport